MATHLQLSRSMKIKNFTKILGFSTFVITAGCGGEGANVDPLPSQPANRSEASKTTPDPIESQCAGDLNRDQSVDMDELLLVTQNLGATTSAADLTSDGLVDQYDLEIVQNFFGKSCVRVIPRKDENLVCTEDVNGDGSIDFADVLIATQNLWEAADDSSTGDVNQNGLVDKHDLQLINDRLGDSCN